MKKFTAFLLALTLSLTLAIPAFAQDTAFGSYSRVVIIGVDGAGAFFDDTPTPECDSIFAERSAVTYKCLAEARTVSAQCWGAMLMGVSYIMHGLDNGTVDTVERTSNEKYPTIFRTVRENDPDATLASFCNWNPINHGIIECDIGVYEDTAGDDVLTEKIVDYLGENDPKLLFVQFDSVDGAGHGGGYGKERHLQQITTVDGYIGAIYDRYEQLGRIDDTLFIVTADHGGTPRGSHGGLTRAEQEVFLGIRGKNVTEGTISCGVKGRDVASIALYALGVAEPERMISIVPEGLFNGEQTEQTAFETFLLMLKNFLSRIKEMF